MVERGAPEFESQLRRQDERIADIERRLREMQTPGQSAVDGGGREYATVVVAASNSHDDGKRRANLVCGGADDHEPILQALGIAHQSGRRGSVELLEGDYILGAPITDSGANSVPFSSGYRVSTLRGQGLSTVLRTSASMAYCIDVAYCDVKDMAIFPQREGVGGVRVTHAQEVSGLYVEAGDSLVGTGSPIGIDVQQGSEATLVTSNFASAWGGSGARAIRYEGSAKPGGVIANSLRGSGYVIELVIVKAFTCCLNRSVGGDGPGIKAYYCENTDISHNVLEDKGGPYAIFLESCRDCLVGANLIPGFDGTAAINLLDTDQTNVEGNLIRGSSTHTIRVEDAASNDNRVTNNDIVSSITDNGTTTITAAGNRS